ncbi:hypothetical protein RIF29_01954 [Crotalaria pallida]|uniref:Uncharacterized protein n=1 Tax=Crotalaria pallida TaxID=3830 RepID=A0AAN9IYL5_CROPI
MVVVGKAYGDDDWLTRKEKKKKKECVSVVWFHNYDSSERNKVNMVEVRMMMRVIDVLDGVMKLDDGELMERVNGWLWMDASPRS